MYYVVTERPNTNPVLRNEKIGVYGYFQHPSSNTSDIVLAIL